MSARRASRWLVAVSLLASPASPQPAGSLYADGFEHGLCSWSDASGGEVGRVLVEDFALADGEPWPAPWTAIGGVAESAIEAGEARWRPTPSGYSLGRLYAALAARDVEVTFTLRLDDAPTQGVGFYVRQNGGYLQQSSPHGSGYAVFVEGTFRGLPGVSLWKEQDGVEIQIQNGNGGLQPQSDFAYRVRYRVTQVNASTTRLSAKLWPAASSEPVDWSVTLSDATPSLQGVSGGVAVDSWSVVQSPDAIPDSTRIDDVEVRALCNPVLGLTALAPVVTGVQFGEGPLWRGDHLLYTALDASTVHRLDPPSAVSVFRSPSDVANGLATAGDGALLAAEHSTRRVSRTDPQSGTISTLVGDYQGQAFNSPNDLAVRWDGTVYFTDPDYGLANPGDRELAFNGLFRYPPGGPAVAEWQGTVGANEPNGVALSPDQDVLYATDTQAGTLSAWDVGPDGTLANPRLLAGGLATPDGLCVDHHGNLWVATWGPPFGLRVYSPLGAVWGSVATPTATTNCEFGGEDRRSLYVTTLDALLRTDALIPGQP